MIFGVFLSSALVGATSAISSYEGILRVNIFSISDPDVSVKLNYYGNGNLTDRYKHPHSNLFCVQKLYLFKKHQGNEHLDPQEGVNTSN